MNDKIITLNNMKNISIDELIDAYRSGYKLEDSYDPNISQIHDLKNDNIKYLQTEPLPIAMYGMIFVAGLAAGALTFMLLRSK